MTTDTLEILDLFCCEGCAAVGYWKAGFVPTGVDLDLSRLRYYPFASELGDAIDFALSPRAARFDAIHASPPCQAYSRGNAGRETAWPKLIPAVREALRSTGKPFVIENVLDAGPDMIDPVLLCGCMFDLQAQDADGVTLHLQRPRLFETNWGLTAPRVCEGEGRPRREHPSQEHVAGVYGGSRRAKRREGESLAEVAPRDRHAAKHVRKGGYVPRSKEVAGRLLGVSHPTTWQGLKESVPPAYTEHIGTQLLAHIRSEAAA